MDWPDIFSAWLVIAELKIRDVYPLNGSGVTAGMMDANPGISALNLGHERG